MRASGRDIRAGEQAGGQSPVAQRTRLCARPVPEGYLTFGTRKLGGVGRNSLLC